ncbi:MAG: ABC transporter permease, partial [Singulisphaera sp.]
MCRLALTVSLASLLSSIAAAHDIPNARVDRSIQVTLGRARLAIDYEVSLAELTLTQELRSLIGALPGADRRDWFGRYGEVTGPLNAKGLLVT